MFSTIAYGCRYDGLDDFIADVNRLGVGVMHGSRSTTGVLPWRKGPVIGGVMKASYGSLQVWLLSGGHSRF